MIGIWMDIALKYRKSMIVPSWGSIGDYWYQSYYIGVLIVLILTISSNDIN